MTSRSPPARPRQIRRRTMLCVIVSLAAAGLTTWSAIVAKRSGAALPLVMIDRESLPEGLPPARGRSEDPAAINPAPIRSAPDDGAPSGFDPGPIAAGHTTTAGRSDRRFFDGRVVRPQRVMWMRVTAYSPDERSCGIWADGRTASNHSVWTNAMELVAADTSLLPMRSLVSVPGYADERIVPVLDRGAAIKGNRLDVLFPTHQLALDWGVQDLPVVVWEYVPEGDESGSGGGLKIGDR